MNKFLLLLRTMLKTDDVLGIEGNKGGKFPPWLKYLGLAVLFLFISIGTSVIIIPMYDFLKPLGLQYIILKLVLLMASVLSTFLAFLYIINAFYFSKDNENYLYLPVEPGKVILAKLFSVLIFETASAVLLFYPAFVIFGRIAEKNIDFYLMSLAAVISVPIIPLSIIGIFIMVLMKFSHFFRNKERFQLISMGFAILMAVGFNLMVPRLIIAAENGVLPAFLTGKGISGKILSFLFPGAMILEEGIRKPELFFQKFLITIALAALVLVLFYITGQKFWSEGAQGMSESSSSGKKLKGDEIRRLSLSSSSVISIFKKEMKYLFRTPAYVMNAVLGTVLLPIIFLFPFIAGGQELNRITGDMDLKSVGITEILTVTVIFMFAYSLTSMIATTAVSREGDNFYFMKYIPVSYRIQILGKILPAALLSLIAFIPLLTGAVLILKIKPLYALISFLAGIPSVISGLLISIIPDIIKPNLSWTSETKAVKQNINTLLSFIIGALYLALIYFLINLGMPFKFLAISHILFSALLGLLIWINLERICRRFFKNLP